MMSKCSLYAPVKRRFAANDPFFDLGNAEVGIDYISKQLVVAAPSAAMNVEDLLDASSVLQHPIICHDPPCLGSAVFPTALAFERHYDILHRNTCSVCGAVFPSSHWLDLHIQEFHDAFFSAQVARGDKPFQCFIPSCTKTFSSPLKRKLHMIDKHRFARSFNWMLVCEGNGTPRKKSKSTHRYPDIQQQQNRNQQQDAANDQYMDVDQLSSVFQRSACIVVPKKISFRRR